MTDDLAQRVSSSRNFRFLVEPALLLAGDAVLAEAYADSDPSGAMTKARMFGETLAKMAMRRAEMDPDKFPNQFTRIEELWKVRLIPEHVRQLLHDIRKTGNQAVHDHFGDREMALNMVRACFDLGVWWYQAETGQSVAHTFTAPAPAEAASLRERLKNVEDRITRLQPAGQDRARSDNERGSLGRSLFSDSVGRHSGRLCVAFAADDTLAVTEQDGTVHRWSLRDSARLPGVGVSLPRNSLIRWGTGTAVAVSTTMPAVAIARRRQVSLVHFTEEGPRTKRIPLRGIEFLIWGAGQRFATYDKHRVTVRDFADGAIIWEQQSSRQVARAAVDTSGTTMAIASFSGPPETMGSADKLVVASQHDSRRVEMPIHNLPVMAGCELGLSARGDMVVCASFTEIVVSRAATGEVLQRLPLDVRLKKFMPGVGSRPEPLICLPDARVIWLRDQHVVVVNWAEGRLRDLPQEGLCDDIAFDHVNSRLAMVNNAGKVDVYQW